MNVNTIGLVQELMSMDEPKRDTFFENLDYEEAVNMAYKFYEALTEVIELDDEPDFTIPSWEEVEEILNMESERGIK